ncbi:MAG: GHKL domain-containing protein [Oscillospiraceae bacterium]|nr:GHKL domain-containing protein [Oscillospiraceae bacterium]
MDVKHIFTTKRNPQNHGFGLRSIQTIAKKYNGDVFLSCEDQKFNTYIILTNE